MHEGPQRSNHYGAPARFHVEACLEGGKKKVGERGKLNFLVSTLLKVWGSKKSVQNVYVNALTARTSAPCAAARLSASSVRAVPRRSEGSVAGLGGRAAMSSRVSRTART